MKIATSILAGLIFMSALDGIASAKAEDGVLSKDELTAGSDCHEKFPAIRPSTLGTDNPTPKSANTGDVIDFCGPCNETGELPAFGSWVTCEYSI